MARKNNNQVPVQLRPPVTRQEAEMMLITLLRMPSAFLAAKGKLLPKHLQPYGPGLQLSWQAATSYYAEFNRLPKKSWTSTKVSALVELLSEGEDLDDDDIDQINEFVEVCYDIDQEDLDRETAVQYLRRVLDDSLFNEMQRAVSSSDTPENMPKFLTEYQQRSSSNRLLEASALDKPFEAGWNSNRKIVDKRPLRIQFLDDMLGGGHATKEVHGLLAPYGGGKTLTMMFMATQIAHGVYHDWRAECQRQRKPDNEVEVSISYYISYEEPVDSLRLRALCSLAQIPKDTLEEAINNSDYDLFSRDGDLKPYEKQLFAEALGKNDLVVRGELSRFRQAQRELNATLRLVDMTGADEKSPNRGHGLTEEIASIIACDQEHWRQAGHKVRVETVLVDYVKASVLRHMSFNKVDRSEMRHLIGEFPFNLKQQVGTPFNCPTWACHQLNAVANSYKPGTKIGHTDAAESKAFAENLDFCFVYGTMNHDSMAVLWPTKARRKKLEREIVIRIDGEMGRVDSMDDNFAIRNGQIQSKADGVKTAREPEASTIADNEYPTAAVQQQLVRANRPANVS